MTRWDGGTGFIVSCRLTRTSIPAMRSCPSVQGFASGFLPAPPHGDAAGKYSVSLPRACLQRSSGAVCRPIPMCQWPRIYQATKLAIVSNAA